jgi:UDP-GlcNAc:undecaprenyl-phosphate GlcNAc-1-phosphate transferase
MPVLSDLLHQPVFLAAAAFSTALLLGVAAVPFVRRLAHRVGAIDQPGDRRVHRRATPRLGGIAVVGSALIALALSALLLALVAAPGRPFGDAVFGAMPVGFLVLLIGLALVGGIDDVRQLSARRKLLGTVVVAIIAWVGGLRLEAAEVPGLGLVSLGTASLPLTVLWITAVTHALNLVDGIDGLAGTVALVALAGAAASFGLQGAWAPLTFAAAIGGALVAFLRANWYPASVFLGDAGALALGGVLAGLAVMHPDADGIRFHLAVSDLLLLAYPIADTGIACLRRFLRGVPISSADSNHLHHRLLASGVAQPFPTILIGLWASGMAAVGLAVRHADQPAAEWVLLIGATVVGGLLLRTLGRLRYVEFDALLGGVQRVARFAVANTRERIHLREAAGRFQQANSLEAAGAVLSEAARQVQLVHAELTRSSARRQPPVGTSAALWQLDWPLLVVEEPPDDPLLLRIYGELDGSRPQSASRFAEEFSDTIERWLTLPRRQELRRQRPGRRAGDTPGRSGDRDGLRGSDSSTQRGGTGPTIDTNESAASA